MAKRISRKIAVTIWVLSGVKDFFIAFKLSEIKEQYLDKHTPFLYHQGLEKICKAYIIGKEARQYRTLSHQKARAKIDEIARDHAHNLNSMIERLIRENVIPESLLSKVWSRHEGRDVKGKEIIEALQKGYTESRYPLAPDPVHRKYLFQKRKKLYWDLLYSSEPEIFAYAVSFEIIQKIEKSFRLKIQRDKFHESISDKEWERFRRLFFKDI